MDNQTPDNFDKRYVSVHGKLILIPTTLDGRIKKNGLMRLLFMDNVMMTYEQAAERSLRHDVTMDRTCYNKERCLIHGRQRKRKSGSKPKPAKRPPVALVLDSVPQPAPVVVPAAVASPPPEVVQMRNYAQTRQVVLATETMLEAARSAKTLLKDQPDCFPLVLELMQQQLTA